jgi:hypothetical protein
MDKYLPSREFVIRLLIIALIGAIGLTVYSFITRRHTEHTSPKDAAETKLFVKNLVQKDSNDNGIPDWQEKIWGLDPTKDGDANKEFILSKRAGLAKQNPLADASSPATSGSPENQALAQEFFAVVISLEQNGQLDDATLQSISDAIGQKVSATPLADTYKKGDLTITSDDTVDIYKYYTEYFKLFTKYKGKNIGDELTFIAAGLKDSDRGAMGVASDIGKSYEDFGHDLAKIPVPESFASLHLDLANNYEKVGQSIVDMSKVFDDPITSMKAIINYKKYSDALLSDMDKMAENFK